MYIYKNPDWIDCRLLSGKTLDQIPQSVYDEINERLDVIRGTSPPLVSVVIPAFNEELTILRTLYSLSQNVTTIPTEIIVVNNNSTDRTQEVLDRLNIQTYFQPKQGWGPARQMGQENAKGKYILMADADCFYPPRWIQRMATELMKEGVTCVYGGYSFIGYRGKSRWKFFIYEALRQVVSEIRHVNRPWYNCVGMCMGYVKELGLKVGFVDKMIRGEDGRMCYELAQLGKIVRVRSNEVVVWTVPRTFQKDRSLVYSILNRALIEFSRFRMYFQKQPAHDTHTSANFTPPNLKYFRKSRP
jgi:glycosyltransferase involved in cell wall biosynthesis